MFDIGWQELTLVVIVAIIVIGPRELPGTIRTIGRFVGKLKVMAREFQGQMDEMAREAELEDVRKGITQAQGLNPKNMIKNAIDADGSLEKKLNEEVKAGEDEGHDLSWMKTPSPQPLPEAEKPASVAASDEAAKPEKTGTGGA